ncbi:toxin VasX [Pseudomonas sp. NPDC098747]|uniref:toxin VasX n=1 Tax=Pseudomonas sp. NPDC098747 TaxID=3364487 RepID=UPI00383BDED1
MTTAPLDKNRSLAAADQAAQCQFGDEELSSPATTCPARQPEIFVVPSRYAMAEQAAEHADFAPSSPTKSHPMALRRLRAGYVYLWHAEGPLKRYAVASDGLLVEQPLTKPHSALTTGENAGIALNKSTDVWMLYSEVPLGKDACERLKKNGERRKRMRQIALTDVAKRLSAKHCPPLEKAPTLVAELMPKVREKTLAHEHQKNGATDREGVKEQRKTAQAAPTQDNIKAYSASSESLREREQAAGTQPPGEPVVEPGNWSASPWELAPTQAWLDKAKSESAPLYAVFAALDDDLGVLRDIDHEQNKVEAEHEEWVADNSLRQTIGSFIRNMVTEDGGEVANLLNYRYREHNLQLTPEQGDTLIDSQKQLNTLMLEETRINQQRGRQYGHAQADGLLAQVRSREEAVLNKVRSFIPSELHQEAQQVVRDYRQEKTSNLEGGGGTKVGEYIDLASMDHWLDQEAPQHFKQVEERHQLLYADRKTYLPRNDSGTWFVDQSSEEHLKWLESLTIACLSAQCSRSEGAKQFADYVSSDDPGLLRLVFQAWSPSLEAAVNNTSRLNELVTALSLENLADSRAAAIKILDTDTLRNIERLASNLEGAWTATMTRLGASLIHASKGTAMAMGLFLVIRLGDNTRLVQGVENGIKVWRLVGQNAEALSQWTRSTAQAISLGRVNGIVNAPSIKASGGLLPLAALVVNILNAGTYAGQAGALEGSDEQRQADSLSAYLYAGAALGAVIQNWMLLGKGVKDITGRLPLGLSATAPTLTLFSGVVGWLSAAAAYKEFKSLQIQIESAQSNIDPWLKIKQLAVAGQVAVYGAQALLGLGLTGMRLSNQISTPVAIKRFRLGMGPMNFLLLALGGLYLFAWLRQASPLQNYLANCCWSHRRANTNKAIEPQAQLDEINELMMLLYQPRVSMETREVRISGVLGDTITQDAISQLSIDLPGAAPGAAQIDLSMSGNPTPVSAGFGTGTRGTPTDLGATWLNASQCTWISADAGQGLRLTGSFSQPLTRLSLRVCYLSPVALLAGDGATIGGTKGLAYTLSPNGGLLSPDGEIITLRSGEPTPELDRASVHRLGPQQNSNYLTPKDKA